MTLTYEEGLRNATVDVVDAIARDAIFWGANPIKLWTQVSTRIVAAARTSTSPQEWASRLLRSLRIENASLPCSRAIEHLVIAVGPDSDAWLTMVEREVGYLVAAVRVRRDDAKSERQRAKYTDGDADPAETLTPDGKRRGRKTKKSEPDRPAEGQSDLWSIK